MRKYIKYVFMGILAVIISAILFPTSKETLPMPRTYNEIIQSGVLRAVTEYNSLNYYAKGDSIEGFHYELLKAFAKEKDLLLEVTPVMSMEERLKGIINGTFDILANDVLIASDRKDSLLYTQPITLSKQVLIQRKPMSDKDSSYIQSQLDLAGKKIHIVKVSPYKFRIENLANEIGDTIIIEEVDKYGVEQLLALVAHNDIDYAVCDEGLAQALIKDYPQLDMTVPVSFTQFYAWGTDRGNSELIDTLNRWLNTYTQSKAFKKLKLKYNKD